jgi:hypothetical protein
MTTTILETSTHKITTAGTITDPSELEKMVSIGDIINILPLGTKRKLTAISLIDNEDGDIADLILMFMTIGDPVDANGGKFTKQTNWMMSKTELNITQEHIDEIKAS